MSYNIESDWYGNSRELEHERDMMEYRGAMMEDRLTASLDEAELHARMSDREALEWRNRAEEAEEKLADYIEGNLRVLADEGAPDEVHCGCVPVLRDRIAELEQMIERLIEAGQPMSGDFIDVLDVQKWHAVVAKYRESKERGGK